MKYVSDSILAFSLKVGKSVKRIRFIPYNRGGSYYVTNDNAEITALEKSSGFNKIYRKSPEKTEQKVTEDKKPFVKVEEITTFQDAVAYLSNVFASDKSKLKTPDDIFKEAESHRVSFPNLK